MARYATSTEVALRNIGFLSWVAGLFEGEGTVTITRSGNRGYTRPLVALTSTDKSVVELLQSRWPGSLTSHQPKGNAKIAHTWRLHCRRPIIRFLFDIEPFIRTQRVREKCWVVIDDISARIQGPGGPGYLAACHERRERIRRLNQRGRV